MSTCVGLDGGQLEAAGQVGSAPAFGPSAGVVGRPVVRSAAVVRARAATRTPRGAPAASLRRPGEGREWSSWVITASANLRRAYAGAVMQEPLEQLLAQLHDAIEASEDGADNKEEHRPPGG